MTQYFRSVPLKIIDITKLSKKNVESNKSFEKRTPEEDELK